MTVDQFRAILLEAFDTLHIADQLTITRVDQAADGQWSADVEIVATPGRRVSIAATGDRDEARLTREVRSELRRALRMCPLCQRIGHVEKLRDAQGQQEACAVRCPACGEFEIDQALIRELRSAWERDDRSVLDRLPAVSDATRQGRARRLTKDDWGAAGSDLNPST